MTHLPHILKVTSSAHKLPSTIYIVWYQIYDLCYWIAAVINCSQTNVDIVWFMKHAAPWWYITVVDKLEHLSMAKIQYWRCQTQVKVTWLIRFSLYIAASLEGHFYQKAINYELHHMGLLHSLPNAPLMWKFKIKI